MKRVVMVAGAGVVLLTIVSCSPSSPGYRIATESQPYDAGMLALMQGVLNGEVNPDGTTCLWVGDATDRTATLWLFGFYAAGSPLAVFNSAGPRAATVGRPIKMGGGLEPDSVHSILGCSGFAQFWAANGPPEEI